MNRFARQSTGSSGELGVRKHRPDYGLLIIASILLGIGLVVMYAISPALAAQGGNVSDNYFVSRQFIAIILGLAAFWFTSKVPFSFWQRWQIGVLREQGRHVVGNKGVEPGDRDRDTVFFSAEAGWPFQSN